MIESVTTDVAPKHRFLIVLGKLQQLPVLEQIIEDLGHEFTECLSSEAEAIVLAESYDVLIFAHDVSLETIREVSKLAGNCKCVLIGGGKATDELATELQHKFSFDLFVRRPISSSFLALQLQSIFETESEDLGAVEKTELNFVTNLKSGYVNVLDDRVFRLSEAVTALLDKAHSVPLKLEAQRLAHNMGGTSSSCGLARVASLAFRIEKLLKANTLDARPLIEALANLNSEAKNVKDRHQKLSTNNQNLYSSMTVLALMNEEFDRDICRQARQSSVNLIVTETKEQLIRSASDNVVDAILIDLSCQSTDGLELATTLRGSENLGEIPMGFIQKPDTSEIDKALLAHIGGSVILRAPLDAASIIDACSYLVSLNENGRPRILIVDDDEDFSELLANTLCSNGMIVKSCTNPTMTEGMLKEFGAELLIVDARMPEQSGIDLCLQLRSNPRWTDLPILFLTAERELETRIKAYEAGADDYLSKPLIVPELLARVRGRLERAKLLRERVGKDSLTGLLSRRCLIERLESLLQDAARHEYTCSICLIDIDHFKSVNDTYGHTMGDIVLAELGRLLGRRFRAGDLRGRWGGEEFVLALPRADSDTVKTAIERVLDEFKLREFDFAGQKLSGVSFSGGMATFPADGSSYKELFLCADENLYKAKRAGRSRITE